MLEHLFFYLKSKEPLVEMGKMMSCPGVTYKGKVFCFEYKDKIVFKLGKAYDMNAHGILEYEYLNPFKKKGPMLAWFVIERVYENKFEELSFIALNEMKQNI